LRAVAASRASNGSPRPHSPQHSHSIAQNMQHTTNNRIAPNPIVVVSIIILIVALFLLPFSSMLLFAAILFTWFATMLCFSFPAKETIGMM